MRGGRGQRTVRERASACTTSPARPQQRPGPGPPPLHRLFAVAECAADGTPSVHVHDALSRRRKCTLAGLSHGRAPVTALAFVGAEGRQLLVQTGAPEWNLHLALWDKAPGGRVLSVAHGVAGVQGGGITVVEAHPLDPSLVAASGSCGLRLLRVADGALKPLAISGARREPGQVTCLAWLDEGPARLVIAAEGGAELWLYEGAAFARGIARTPPADKGGAPTLSEDGGALVDVGGAEQPGELSSREAGEGVAASVRERGAAGATCSAAGDHSPPIIHALVRTARGFLAGCAGGWVQVYHLQRSAGGEGGGRVAGAGAVGAAAADLYTCVAELYCGGDVPPRAHWLPLEPAGDAWAGAGAAILQLALSPSGEEALALSAAGYTFCLRLGSGGGAGDGGGSPPSAQAGRGLPARQGASAEHRRQGVGDPPPPHADGPPCAPAVRALLTQSHALLTAAPLAAPPPALPPQLGASLGAGASLGLHRAGSTQRMPSGLSPAPQRGGRAALGSPASQSAASPQTPARAEGLSWTLPSAPSALRRGAAALAAAAATAASAPSEAPPPPAPPLCCLAVAARRPWALSAGADGSLRVWSLAACGGGGPLGGSARALPAPALRAALRLPAAACALALHPEGTQALVAFPGGALLAALGAGGLCRCAELRGVAAASAAAYAHGGHLLALAEGPRLLLFGAHSGRRLAALRSPGGAPIAALAWSPDDACILTAAADGCIAQWELQPQPQAEGRRAQGGGGGEGRCGRVAALPGGALPASERVLPAPELLGAGAAASAMGAEAAPAPVPGAAAPAPAADAPQPSGASASPRPGLGRLLRSCQLAGLRPSALALVWAEEAPAPPPAEAGSRRAHSGRELLAYVAGLRSAPGGGIGVGALACVRFAASAPSAGGGEGEGASGAAQESAEGAAQGAAQGCAVSWLPLSCAPGSAPTCLLALPGQRLAMGIAAVHLLPARGDGFAAHSFPARGDCAATHPMPARADSAGGAHAPDAPGTLRILCLAAPAREGEGSSPRAPQAAATAAAALGAPPPPLRCHAGGGLLALGGPLCGRLLLSLGADGGLALSELGPAPGAQAEPLPPQPGALSSSEGPSLPPAAPQPPPEWEEWLLPRGELRALAAQRHALRAALAAGAAAARAAAARAEAAQGALAAQRAGAAAAEAGAAAARVEALRALMCEAAAGAGAHAAARAAARQAELRDMEAAARKQDAGEAARLGAARAAARCVAGGAAGERGAA